jgi:hypothetical protein
MEDPIKVSYRWSIQEMLLLNRIHTRHSPRARNTMRSIQIGAIIFICLGLLMMLPIGGSRRNGSVLSSGLPLIVLGVGFLVFIPFTTKRALRKMYSKKPDRDMLLTYELTPDGFSSKSEVASAQMDWRATPKCLRAIEGFLLYPSEMQVHWLPVHGFQNSADVERAATLIASKVAAYRDERKSK